MRASERVIIALDVEPDRAYELVEKLGEQVAFYKVGLSLYLRAGNAFLNWLAEQNKRIFLDLKFHDIPMQVGRAVAALPEGVELFTVHASGGKEMVSAARRYAPSSSKVIAVTVLTSLTEEAMERLGRGKHWPFILAEEAAYGGADGFVCAGTEVRELKRQFPDMLAVVPGIRLEPSTDDQKRVVLPQEALEAGADYLVVGRPVTQAEDPLAAWEKLQNLIDG